MSESIKDLFCQPTYERALLAFCFKAISDYYTIATSVEVEDFLRSDHKIIFSLFKAIEKQKVNNFDSAIIINEAKKNGVLTEIGGYEYIHAIEDFNTAGENIDFYIAKVLDSSAKYFLYKELSNRIAILEDNATVDDVPAVDLIDSSESAILQVSIKARAVKEATNLADGIDDYLDELQNNPITMCGIPTGFSIFDKRIDGLTPGSVTVVAARPKCGKSTLLTTIAANVAFRSNKPVLFVDTEMSFEEFRNRILAILSGLPEITIKHGGYTDQQRHALNIAARLIKSGRLFHEYCPGYSVDKLIALYRKYKHREDIGMGVFDYIKSPKGADYKNKKEYQILGDVTTAIKDMAGMLQIPFLVATQINRQQDIADSDRILRFADVISFLKQKTPDEIIEEGGLDAGTHRWVITDSRRGGATKEEGIGINFIKKSLQIYEAKKQFVNFDGKTYNDDNNAEHESDRSTDECSELFDEREEKNFFA